jgi:hypothetical protein
MRFPDFFSLIFAALLFPAFAVAQVADNATEFHSRIVALYSFDPHKLTKDEMQTKSAELDKFWDAAKKEPEKTLPLLRAELKDIQNPPFFAYDGSKLLLSLSENPADQQLALKCLPRADLKGVQGTDYLTTVHRLAAKGYDSTQAALRILDYPDFSAFIAQHSLKLEQHGSLIYMLAPMEESRYLGPLMARLDTESDLKSQKSILMALWYAATPEAKARMERFSTDQSKPAESRNYAKELLGRKVPVPDAVSLPSLEKLREDRREVMKRPISDEALIEFDQLTAKIIAKQQ